MNTADSQAVGFVEVADGLVVLMFAVFHHQLVLGPVAVAWQVQVGGTVP